SRASNPDLSVLREMQFAAARHSAVRPAELLRMITANAARALGRDDEIGTLKAGKLADLTVVTLPKTASADPHELLLDWECQALATVFRGRGVYGENVLFAPRE